jgi:hypothetical protein
MMFLGGFVVLKNIQNLTLLIITGEIVTPAGVVKPCPIDCGDNVWWRSQFLFGYIVCCSNKPSGSVVFSDQGLHLHNHQVRLVPR